MTKSISKHGNVDVIADNLIDDLLENAGHNPVDQTQKIAICEVLRALDLVKVTEIIFGNNNLTVKQVTYGATPKLALLNKNKTVSKN